MYAVAFPSTSDQTLALSYRSLKVMIYLESAAFFLGLQNLRVKTLYYDLVFLAEYSHDEVVVWGPFEATQDFIEDEFFLHLKLI